MFEHALLNKWPLNRIDDPDLGRVYELIEDEYVYRYPSVTNVISKYYDDGSLQKWKDRVGAEEANKRSTQAKRRGTAMHALYEDYLLNRLVFDPKIMPINILDFKKVQPILDRHVTKVLGVEHTMFSHGLMVAGTTDAIVEWDGLPTIVDFKTSKRLKKINEIPAYLTQATCYAIMTEELYDIEVPQIAIIMTVDHEQQPLIFLEDNFKYRAKVREICTGYSMRLSQSSLSQ